MTPSTVIDVIGQEAMLMERARSHTDTDRKRHATHVVLLSMIMFPLVSISTWPLTTTIAALANVGFVLGAAWMFPMLERVRVIAARRHR